MTTITNQTNHPNFFPLTQGSYWVYETFIEDSNGQSVSINKTDSFAVDGDTVIRGESYARIKNFTPYQGNPNYNNSGFYRDSSGYIIHSAGGIVVTYHTYTDTIAKGSYSLNDSTLMYYHYGLFEYPTQNFTVPAGSFNALTMRVTYHMYNGSSYDPYDNLYVYGEGVGRLMDTYFFASQPDVLYKRKLVRYHIEN